MAYSDSQLTSLHLHLEFAHIVATNYWLNVNRNHTSVPRKKGLTPCMFVIANGMFLRERRMVLRDENAWSEPMPPGYPGKTY